MPTNRQTQSARAPQRRRIVSQTFAPPAGSSLKSIKTALSSLVAAAKRKGPSRPALITDRAAIGRKAEKAATAGACKAMSYLLQWVSNAVLEHAARRERLITVAWARLRA